jgi:tetratricopeptide (TPR) repeat protein
MRSVSMSSRIGRIFRQAAMGLILLTVFGNTAAVRAQTQVNPDSTVALIRSLYNEGKYPGAEFEARRLLEWSSLSDSVRIVLEQYLAFALVAQGEPQSAVEHFTAILLLDPYYELDLVLTSPKIITVFNDAKLKYISRKSQSPPRRITSDPPLELSRPTWRTIVFPGWEQLYHGRTTAGIIYGGAGAAAAVSLVFCDIQRRSKRDEYLAAATSSLARTRYSDYNNYYKAEVYSAIALAAVYLASQLDVLLTPPQVLVQDGRAALSIRLPF